MNSRDENEHNEKGQRSEERDCKGLYKLARSGAIKQFTGISDPFEGDLGSEVVVKFDSLENQVNQVMDYIKNIGLI